jgi:ribose 5-phosphate isomerase A
LTDHGSTGFNPLQSQPGPPPGTVDALAQAAVADVRSGMIVGLGTGRTASRAVRALAQRLRDEKLDIDCVSTSRSTETLAKELGLPTVPFADIEMVDFLFDGADEVDHELRMMKGAHGALTRQRLVANVCKKCVYLATEEKLVTRLGSRGLLAVTIIPFGIASIRAELRSMGLSGVVRRNFDGEPFMTDGGGVVLDMRLPDRNPDELALQLDHVPGVVDHGLFLYEADEVLIECKGGEIKRLKREE